MDPLIQKACIQASSLLGVTLHSSSCVDVIDISMDLVQIRDLQVQLPKKPDRCKDYAC